MFLRTLVIIFKSEIGLNFYFLLFLDSNSKLRILKSYLSIYDVSVIMLIDL